MSPIIDCSWMPSLLEYKSQQRGDLVSVGFRVLGFRLLGLGFGV